MSTMSTKSLIGIWLTLMLFLAGTASAQGMGDRKGYDYMGTPDMGTPVVSGDTQMGEYVNPYAAGRPEWDPYGQGTSASGWGLDSFAASRTAYGAYSLQIESADPASEGLGIGDTARLSNQLYLQRGLLLVTEGSVALGEPYTLWARVAGRGSFSLYDYNNPLFRQENLAAGWYRISGAYADFLGPHIYRFTSSSMGSNNVTLQAESGSYPTSFSLTGKVVDDIGQGLSGVRVVLSNSEGGTFSTVTDASGIYAIEAASGVYLINAELSGYRFTPTKAHVWTGAVSAAQPIVGYPAAEDTLPGAQSSY